MRIPRRVRWFLFGLILLIGLGLSGFWFYLQSSHAANLVADKLTQAINAPVRVESVSVNGSQSTVKSVELFEKSGDITAWAHVEKVEVDVSIWNLLFNQIEPKKIRLSQPRVTLRFDNDGRLITKFPQMESKGEGAIPSIFIHGGELTIQQEGHPEVTFHGIDAHLDQQNQLLVFNGTARDEEWGNWSLDGSFDPKTRATRATLQTRDLQPVDPQLLAKTPFVPARVWRSVEIQGRTPAEIILNFEPKENRFHYRVALEPSEAKVFVPSIDLRTQRTSGKLLIEDGLLTLSDVQGQLADGTLRVDGTLDFRGETGSSFNLNADAQRLDVRTLPPLWGVPRQLEGRLTGKANLNIDLPFEGNVRTSGRGRGVIAEAKLLGWLIEPIVLILQPAREGFVFQPLPNEKAPPTPVLGWPNLILKGIAYLLNADAEGKKDTTYLTIKLNLKEIDLAEAFKQFELPLPVSLRGKVSINAQVDIPTDSTGDWKTYRVRGPVSSSRLEVEGLPLEKLSANLNLDKGIVSISDFIGTIPGPEGHLGGSFHVDGNVTLKEGYPFQANVELSRTSLAAIEKLTGPLPLVLQGDLTTTGQLSGKLSPLTVTGSGSAEVKKLLLGILPLDGVQFQWQTDGDRISLKKIDAATGTGKLSGEATIPIRDRAEGSAALKLEGYDLGEISKRFSANAKLKLEGRASGSITAKIPPVAKGGTRSVTAEIDLQAPKLKLQGLPAERIKGTANYAEETLKYQLTGDTLGGKFEVDGQYPSPKPKVKPQLPPKKEDDAPTQGRLKLQNIRLSRILKQLKIPNTLDSLEAELSASFPFEFDEQGFLTGVGDAQIDRLRWKEKEIFTKLTGTVRLTEETLRIENLSANLGEGSLRGGIFFNRKNPDRSRMRLTLSHVPANRLLFFMPDLAKVFDAAIDLTMSGTIGSQINLVGTVAAEHGKINGVPVSELRLPFQFDFAPSSGRAELRIREATGQVARGKVNGKLELDFYSDLPSRVEGEVQFTNVNVQMIADGAEAVTGNNPVTGKFDFNGTNVQSVNDLKGSLRANLGEAKPLLLPLLSDLVPFLGPGNSVTSLIRQGEVRASLSNGLFRFQKFSLNGPQLSLFIDGTISLLGRVDLDVVAQAGNFGLDSRLVRLARLALPLTGVGIPVRIAADASRILSNRTIRLEITGTLRNHTVRIKPLALLSDEAIRYFLEQAIGR